MSKTAQTEIEMAVLAQYGALNFMLGLDVFREHTAQFHGSMNHGYIRLFVKDQLTLESYYPSEILEVLAKFIGTKEVVICEYNGNRSTLVAVKNEDDELQLRIKWSIKDENGMYRTGKHLNQMNAGTRLHFLDPQAVQLLALLAEQESMAT